MSTPPSTAGKGRRFGLPEHAAALEERYWLLFDSSTDAIFLEDTKGRIVSANPAAERLTGFTSGELVGRVVEELVAPEWRDRGQAQLDRKLLGEVRQTEHESVLLDRTGQRIPIRVSSALVQLDDGMVGVQAVVRDLSAERRADAALRESEERFRVVFDAASVGMALTSIDGRWLKVNPALCAMVGYAAAELLTMSYQELTHPDDLAPDLALGRRMLAGELDSFQMEKRYIHREGHVVPVLLNVALVRDAEGAPAYSVAQIVDDSRRAGARSPDVLQGVTLTRREREVLGLLAHGATSGQVSVVLGIGEETVQTHIRRARARLAARTRTEAVATATRLGLLDDIAGSARAA